MRREGEGAETGNPSVNEQRRDDGRAAAVAASDGVKDDSTDTNTDTKGLFSPAQWRNEEEEKEMLALKAQMDAEKAREEEMHRAQLDEQQQHEDVEEDDELEFCPYKFIKSLPSINEVAFTRSPCLPPKTVCAPRLTLVLDLDETLVHCSIDPIPNPELTFNVEHCGVQYEVYARRRPYFQRFIEHVSDKFEVVVFTASQRVYADKLLNILDPEDKLFAHRLFRESCHYHEGNYLKDLRVLGRDLSRVAIIDNSPQAFGFHVENGIPIESWFEDDADEELIRLLPFLDELHSHEDIRHPISEQFRLRSYIDQL